MDREEEIKRTGFFKTGEKVAGFKDIRTGKFTEIMLYIVIA